MKIVFKKMIEGRKAKKVMRRGKTTFEKISKCTRRNT